MRREPRPASVWTSDHILLPSEQPEPFGDLLESLTTLAYLAARTHRIRLATGILVLPQRDPLLVAKQAATIHHLSGGRLILGVGVGWIEREYEYLRAEFHHRGAIEDEYITAIRTLFDNARPEFHGENVQFADALFSPRPTSPLPIVVGGNSPAALTRAATLADGWHGISQSPEQVRTAAATLRATAVRPRFTISLRTPARVGDLPRGIEGEVSLHGDHDTIMDRVVAYATAGVDHLVLEPVADTLDDFLEQMTSLAGLLIHAEGRTSDGPVSTIQ
jgi:probable F420-dependent oxidoreductase